MRRRLGGVFCPCLTKVNGAWQCECETPFPDSTVAAHTAADVFAAHLGARGKLQEETLVKEFEERLKAERARLTAMAADELKVEQTRVHIVERILTLKCPRCDAAFLDFTGCFALTCPRDNAGFCAYCLADCGDDAHRHVANCPHNTAPGRGVFGNADLFTAAQRARRQRMVEEYLATLEDDDLRARVVAACAVDFADLGIDVTV